VQPSTISVMHWYALGGKIRHGFWAGGKPQVSCCCRKILSGGSVRFY
jgi:hypothetical protein